MSLRTATKRVLKPVVTTAFTCTATKKQTRLHSSRAKPASALLVTDKIDAQVLHKLFNLSIAAVRIPNYFPKEQSQLLTKRILETFSADPYHHEEIDEVTNEKKFVYYGVDRIGVPYNSTYGTPLNSEKRKEYFAKSSHFRKMLKSLAAPYTFPIDKLRLDLDEAYEHGAKLGTFGRYEQEQEDLFTPKASKKMFSGIVRIMNAETSYLSEQEPHFDRLPDVECAFDRQISANIYLSVPKEKGELEYWYTGWECSHDTDANAIKRERLGASTIVKPEAGDLILLNPRFPHAIRGFDDKNVVRLSLSSFIGQKQGEPLQIWS